MKSIDLPATVPTSLFLITTGTLLLTSFFSSRKKVVMPYTDKTEQVDSLQKKLDAKEDLIREANEKVEQFDQLEKRNDELQAILNGEDALKTRIVGILLKGDCSTDNLLNELQIKQNDSVSHSLFQIVIGKLSKEGAISATSLGYYKLKQT
eukprot:TRINITY_DN1137_c0_g5_i1.p1 TRINITY_DN1137_c0_g5~~TRINITY_DN1137_c0_g5_i1.p1  ORF type:complete len:151 (+),score=16.95 TRINITY_DN1137_c0_g5_i1:329-781(+)